MTSKERVLAACAFQRPDRIPVFNPLWEFPETWRDQLGAEKDLNDMVVWCPAEGTFASSARVLKEEGGWTYEVDEWGRTIRRKPDAYFYETLSVPLASGVDLDAVQFDPPDADHRFLQGATTLEETDRALADAKRRYFVLGKTGGPFLRSSFVRGEVQFLTDMLVDPPLATAIADKVTGHLTAVGVQEIRRWGLHETGMWIADDMAFNHGPMFSPESFERVLLPAYRRMVASYKEAGAKYVFLHCDGDIRPVLDMLVDAGIDGLNPLERRAGMDPAAIRERYPNLILIGGICNSDTMINGPVARVEAETKEVIGLGRDGGVVIGTHSLGPDVPLEHVVAFLDVCRTYGDFSA